MRRLQFLLATALAVGSAMGSIAVAEKPDVRCVRLENRIAELRLKLRLGYSAQQGRVYRQKLAALEAERRQVCRWRTTNPTWSPSNASTWCSTGPTFM